MLREKIERDPSKPRHIVTVAGSGYMLVREPEQRAAERAAAQARGALPTRRLR